MNVSLEIHTFSARRSFTQREQQTFDSAPDSEVKLAFYTKQKENYLKKASLMFVARKFFN